jgi:hypothetical protein
VLAITASTSLAGAAPKKKKPKPADTTQAAPTPPSAAPEPETPSPAPTTEPTAEEPVAGAEAAPAQAPSPSDITNTYEDPNRRYYFIGLRYRGTIIPQFLVNIFADEGGTVYSNSFGAEIDMRKGGQSMIPWIVFTDFSMGDTLFHQKGATPTGVMGEPGNYSVVNSSLKGLFLGLDELWSAPIDQSHHWDFEFGFGVGLGILFGDLSNNWVYVDNTNGPLTSSAGVRYRKCGTEQDGIGCRKMDHQNAQVAKVGNYKEPFWFSGGSVPSIFPNVWFPTLGVRYKPIKQLETRVGVGFSLTGFWFSISANYGLEKPEDSAAKPHSSLGRLHDML